MWKIILNELLQNDVSIPTDKLENLKNANNIFVYGGGRSGLALKGFAMRLAQMGKSAYVVGETTTPAIKENDLLIAASASGETQGTLNMVKTARQTGAKVWLLSTSKQSTIANIADQITILPGKSKDSVGNEVASKQPMGSLFEQSVWLFGDAVTMDYMKFAGVSESFMRDQHANLE
ncbi:6-phospho-3-hexuloisomerase [Fructilactobacillus vespulae]|uniref:6-phospho-3-hexuloisomerase n=1 Tax=Fructilactobacillus vespulae TaxID=1249630 RepID=UPI0039B3936A